MVNYKGIIPTVFPYIQGILFLSETSATLLRIGNENWGSAMSSPSGIWDGAPGEIEFGAF
jgi:hypothetical protein